MSNNIGRALTLRMNCNHIVGDDALASRKGLYNPKNNIIGEGCPIPKPGGMDKSIPYRFYPARCDAVGKAFMPSA